MKLRFATLVFPCLVLQAFALDGQIGIHDPSTIVLCDGKYYTFGTGSGGLISNDGWTWRGGASRSGGGVAPDVIHIGDRYYMYYATSGAQPRADVHMIWSKTLDPTSPDFKWEDGGIVASSDGVEDCNAIDPGVLLDPNDGKMWLTYGSYFGYIRLMQLDPKTGKRVDSSEKPIDVAINCEASIMIYHDGWYYLLANHGSCCVGANSTYNIRMGRSKNVTGPFLDDEGTDMLRGGGKLFVGSGDRYVGPGHFGLLYLGDGIQKFSCHYEADLDHGGSSVLDIRPVLWKDGWPMAGDNLKGGTFEIESARSGNALELAVQGVPVGGAGGRGGFGRGGGAPIPNQDVTQVSQAWPAASIDVRLGPYMVQAQQKWTIAPVAGAGGYPGSSYFKITLAGTDRALAATEDGELIAVPTFSGEPEQLWRLDQLADATYRIMPKVRGMVKEPMALSAIGASSVTLAKFKSESEKMRWLLKSP